MNNYHVIGKVTDKKVTFLFDSKTKVDKFLKSLYTNNLLDVILLYEDIQGFRTKYIIDTQKCSFNEVMNLVIKGGFPSWQILDQSE